MGAIWLLGHLAEPGTEDTFIPAGMKVINFVERGQALHFTMAMNLLLSEKASGHEFNEKDPFPNDEVVGEDLETVEGLAFRSVTSAAEVGQVLIVGDEISAGKLCTGGESEEEVALGRHSCDGILRKLQDEEWSEVYLLICGGDQSISELTPDERHRGVEKGELTQTYELRDHWEELMKTKNNRETSSWFDSLTIRERYKLLAGFAEIMAWSWVTSALKYLESNTGEDKELEFYLGFYLSHDLDARHLYSGKGFGRYSTADLDNATGDWYSENTEHLVKAIENAQQKLFERSQKDPEGFQVWLGEQNEFVKAEIGYESSEDKPVSPGPVETNPPTKPSPAQAEELKRGFFAITPEAQDHSPELDH